MKVTVNNIEFEFVSNVYGTHNWVAFDYNNVIDENDVEDMYLGNLEVIKFIERILPNVDSKQQDILISVLNLVNDSYIKSVGARLALCEVSYRESLSLSIGNRMRDYQLHKHCEEMLLRRGRRGARS